MASDSLLTDRFNSMRKLRGPEDYLGWSKVMQDYLMGCNCEKVVSGEEVLKGEAPKVISGETKDAPEEDTEFRSMTPFKFQVPQGAKELSKEVFAIRDQKAVSAIYFNCAPLVRPLI